jgi:hypothetical protein
LGLPKSERWAIVDDLFPTVRETINGIGGTGTSSIDGKSGGPVERLDATQRLSLPQGPWRAISSHHVEGQVFVAGVKAKAALGLKGRIAKASRACY